MKRALLLFAVLFAVLAAPAGAHPLGNFSINHVAEVSVSADRVDVRYLLDQAEIPTFQERGVAQAERVRRKQAEVLRHLRVEADGRPLTLTPGAPRLELRPGAGGLKTTRFELALSARVRARTVVVRDETFAGRVGWRAIVARPGEGTAVRSNVPAADPTRGLTRYPADALSSPADIRTARLDARPGDGHGERARAGREGRRRRAPSGGAPERGGEDGLSGLFADAAAGRGRAALPPARRVRLGRGARALARARQGDGRRLPRRHARDRAARRRARRDGDRHPHRRRAAARRRRAHAVGVRAARAAVPVAEPRLGAARGRRRRRRAALAGAQAQGAPRTTITTTTARRSSPTRGILAMGASAGLIPCPSALVVLLAAVAQNQLVLGLVMIVAFSLGLAATLTVLGIAVVHATRLPVPGRIAAALPTASALVIVGVGAMLTFQAAGQLA